MSLEYQPGGRFVKGDTLLCRNGPNGASRKDALPLYARNASEITCSDRS
jgi:hypothetical protein